MIHAEIRSHLASLKAGERTAFIDVHATEGAAAVLAAPSFLSGLTPAELDVVKQRIEARANPKSPWPRRKRQRRCKRPKPVGAGQSGWSAIAVVWGEPPQRPMWPRRVRARAAQGGRGQRLRSLLLWNVRSPLKSRSRPT